MNRHTLPNGLRIVHHYDPTVAMVAVDVLYNVGSRDESPQLTGLAHLFEHLMFGGSKNIPHFDVATENAGGWNNAWTSNDYTNFYDVLPAVNVETAFWLESDRMLALSFSPESLEIQRHVVIEEFKETTLNKPYGDLWHHMRALAYNSHPYRVPTIGREVAHIERVTMDDVRQFYFSHYAPNNAVLSVAGNITFEQTCRLAEKWFGDIPRRDIAARRYGSEPLPDHERELTVRARVPHTYLIVAYPMCGRMSPDYEATDLISDILATGRASRFHRELLLGTSLFTEIDASILGSEEPGLFLINAQLADNTPATIEQARRAIDSQVSRLVDAECSAEELERAVNLFESNQLFGEAGYLAKATNMAMAEIVGDDIDAILPRYRAVTPAKIREVATRLFNPRHRLTLVYAPDGQNL